MPKNSRPSWSKGGRTTSACAARRGRGACRLDLFCRPEDFDQLARDPVLGEEDRGRQPLRPDFRPLPTVWDAVVKRERQLPGQEMSRATRTASTSAARRRVWSANILVVNHALFMSDLAVRAPGRAFLPEYDVAIFDEAHTLEAVAGEHLASKSPAASRVHSDPALQRPHRERAARLSSPARRDRSGAAGRTRRPRDFFDGVAEWQSTRGLGRTAVSGSPCAIADSLGEELRKLATAIGEGEEPVEDDEQKIELTAAAERCDWAWPMS